ncbi:MAG: aminoacetone oxidase family FAD-binding enzyme, partial [Bacteroidota bacterium]|nr:aminoacetone oxidase family FAD-binding enzyme [Bacteroidota bacterium]MDX5430760.1 aminoacetone oxidase family FAD-binding enzyme [Bacteroidota bacterium]MDX5469505.1 aminoacetone oxidase family FAD-binding enzyme [Bacteroidota bacterium]
MLGHCDVGIVGGGAAGFFAALSAAAVRSDARIVIIERSDKLLSKVLISGGGRCNVTHDCKDPQQLIEFYPRGKDFLATGFDYFAVKDTLAWFRERGVKLKTEADGRMFPITDKSETIANCLKNEAKAMGIEIISKCGARYIQKEENAFLLETTKGPLFCKTLIIASGGGAKDSSLEWVRELGIATTPLVPSLFTFNLGDDPIRELAGVSVPRAAIRIRGKHDYQMGPLLVTHWGLSGPAALRLSAWEARTLAAKGYQLDLEVDWTGLADMQEVASILRAYAEAHPKKQIVNSRPFPEIPERLWQFLCNRVLDRPFRNWAECGKNLFKALCQQIGAMPAEVRGKTRFKEEFVTCGGVDL